MGVWESFDPLFWPGNPLHSTENVVTRSLYAVSIYQFGPAVTYGECGYVWRFAGIYICLLGRDMHVV